MSDLAGVCEVVSRSRNVSRDPKNGVNFSDGMVQYARPLLHPYEAGQLAGGGAADGEMILFMEGVKGPVKARLKPYFRCGEFRGMYGPNPYAPNGGK